ncbi:hypothetical protein R69746_08896 [Paraburkholderia aspalathi]|nr:hypothetical protein R69746_08896 [Paraburkholderia aspalathi]
MTTGASSPPFYFVLRTSFSLLIAPSTYVLMLTEGIMLGNGEVWVSGIVEKTTPQRTNIKIIAINNH